MELRFTSHARRSMVDRRITREMVMATINGARAIEVGRTATHREATVRSFGQRIGAGALQVLNGIRARPIVSSGFYALGAFNGFLGLYVLAVAEKSNEYGWLLGFTLLIFAPLVAVFGWGYGRDAARETELARRDSVERPEAAPRDSGGR